MNFNTEIGRIKLEYPVGSTKNIANLKEVIENDWDVSDGYHTFTELYAHRIQLFISLCRSKKLARTMLEKQGTVMNGETQVWRSKLHSDGKAWDGWFIMGINKAPGEQISYHLPESYWAETDFAETLELAPKWDGHTPADVITRLKTL
jgi:hypothetical protein